jgi:hypothetical protein
MSGYLHDSQAVAHSPREDVSLAIDRDLHGDITGFSTGLTTVLEPPAQLA